MATCLLKDSRVVKCYAQALFDLSHDNRDKVTGDARFISELFSNNKDLWHLVNDPVLPERSRIDMIKAMEGQIEDVLLRFLLVLAENFRTYLIVNVMNSFVDMVRTESREIDVVVTSATLLTPDDKKAISDALLTPFGKVVSMQNVIDPSVIGGFIAKFGFHVIDASLKGHLNRLVTVSKLSMLEVI